MIESLIKPPFRPLTMPETFAVHRKSPDSLLCKAFEEITLMCCIVSVVRDVYKKSSWEVLRLILIGCEMNRLFRLYCLLVVMIPDRRKGLPFDSLELVNKA